MHKFGSFALAAILAAGAMTDAAAQTPAADPHHPGAAPSTAQPDQPGTMPPGMMGPGMMGQGMGPGMMDHPPTMARRRYAVKVMFAIADADGDETLSFEEVTVIHKRIFDSVDADNDGRVTADEIQAFMRE